MLLQLLRNDPTISQFIDVSCSENGISINIDASIQADNLLIIKVDRFYNALVASPKPSPDCLVILKCSDTSYKIFIVELKDINSPGHFTIDNIVEKFTNCLGDFMSTRFGQYFHSPDFHFEEIKLLFITDPYDFLGNPGKQLRMRGHRLDALMAQRIPRYFNKHLFIEHKVPNPTIRNCI